VVECAAGDEDVFSFGCMFFTAVARINSLFFLKIGELTRNEQARCSFPRAGIFFAKPNTGITNREYAGIIPLA
jgi:hypothetical protein